MWKIILLILIMLLIAHPCMAIDLDQINAELKNIANPIVVNIADITTESNNYNFWKGQFDPWTKKDTKYQWICTGIMFIDCLNTDIQIKNGGKEINLFLGSEPSTERIAWHFIACSISCYIMSYVLPKKYRRSWQIINITFDSICITTWF